MYRLTLHIRGENELGHTYTKDVMWPCVPNEGHSVCVDAPGNHDGAFQQVLEVRHYMNETEIGIVLKPLSDDDLDHILAYDDAWEEH